MRERSEVSGNRPRGKVRIVSGGKSGPNHDLQKNLFKTIEEPVIRVRALFSGWSMVFLASNSRPVRTLFGYGRLTEGETFHQQSQACASFWNSHV